MKKGISHILTIILLVVALAAFIFLFIYWATKGRNFIEMVAKLFPFK